MEQSASYWAKRALQREAESYLRGAGLSLKLFAEYQAAAATIRKDIEVFFSRYADDNGMSYDDAMRVLNRREMQQWRGTLGQYMDRIDAETDPDMKARLQAELDALAYNSRITRLMALEGQIHLVLNDLFVSGIEQARQEFGDLFQEAYYKRMYDIQSRAGIIFEFAKVDENMVRDVVSYPWSGTEFSGRLWRNRQALVYNLRETITQGLIRGTSAEQMSVQLSDAVGASYKAAERLIRTETNHFHNEASRRAMEAAGVEQYEYMATLDARTSEQCRKLDGKVFPLKDAKEGENYPPMHPNCRSTVVEFDPEEARDWEESGKTMPKGMTYDEWAKEQEVAEASNKPKTKRAPDATLTKTLQGDAAGKIVLVPRGAGVKKVRIIAGQPVKNPFKGAARYSKKVGGSPLEWEKKVGKVESAHRVFDIHWAEHPEYGMIEPKIKNISERK
jgi:SPP1 gp7 family putative phage head morphogenesis protein